MRGGGNATGRGLVWRWVLASAAGWFLGFFMSFAFASSFEGIVPLGPVQSGLAYLVLGLGTGGGVGLAQWLVLRRHLQRSGWWIGASTLGLGIAGGLSYGAAVLIFGYSEDLEGLGSLGAAAGWTLAGALGGALAGLLQGRVLRPHLRRPSGWVLASTLGWGSGFALFATFNVLIYGIVADSLGPIMAVSFLGSLVLGGLVLGVVSGVLLSRLLGSPAGS